MLLHLWFRMLSFDGGAPDAGTARAARPGLPRDPDGGPRGRAAGDREAVYYTILYYNRLYYSRLD